MKRYPVSHSTHTALCLGALAISVASAVINPDYQWVWFTLTMLALAAIWVTYPERQGEK